MLLDPQIATVPSLTYRQIVAVSKYCASQTDNLFAEMSEIEAWAERTSTLFNVSDDVIERATDLFVQQLSEFSPTKHILSRWQVLDQHLM